MKTKGYLYSLIFILTFFAERSFAQKDTAFWFAVPLVSQAHGLYSTDLDTPMFLRITAYSQPSTVTIYQPANVTFVPIVISLPANRTKTVDLSAFKSILECAPADQVLNYGLKISATTPISVYYEENSPLNPELFTLKGSNALGTSFFIPGQNLIPNVSGSGYIPTPYNSFDIIATQDNTLVTITPTQAITGHAAGSTFSVTLNHGQTYSACATSQLASNHLQGSTVTSTKPIAITVKDDLLNATSIWTLAYDLAGDQIIPVSKLGTEYIAVQGALQTPFDAIFILATQNGTTISRNGTPIGTINAGVTQSFYMGGANASTYIQTNNPVYVWQMSGLGGEVGAGILPPITCTGSYEVAFVRPAPILYIQLLVKNGGQNNFFFNGNTTVINGASFTAVPGTGGAWVAAQFQISTAQLPIDSPVLITNSTNLFHMGMVSGTSGGGGEFGFFSNFNSFEVTASDSVSPCNRALFLLADSIPGAVYSWTGPNNFISSAVNPVIANPTSLNTGTYSLDVTYNGCSGTTTTIVQLDTTRPITFNLGTDTTYCSTFSRVLSAGYTATQWSTGVTGTQIQVTTPGLYWAKDSNACGTFIDSILISHRDPPSPFSLGNDTNYCSSFSRTLSTGRASTKWSTGATGSSIIVNAPGVYWAMDSNICGKFRDTIVLTRGTPPVLNLGADTAYCTNFSRTLSISVPNVSYRWSTGAITSSITVSTGGLYWGQDSNTCGIASDTIVLTQNAPPVVNLGHDTTLCTGNTLVLADTSTSATFLWSNNNTTPSINVTTSGTYWLQVIQRNCQSRDTIVATFINPLSVFNLGNDTSYCTNFTRTLSIGVPNVGYRWSTGATTSSITVSTPGLYWGQDSNLCGVKRDTIILIQNAPPVVNLGNDTTLCVGATLTLNDTSTNATFLWSTNAISSSINITSNGTYWLQVSKGNCPTRDTIVATFISPTTTFNLGNDTIYCSNFSRTLSISIPNVHYRWSTGATTDSITVTAPGVYWGQDSLYWVQNSSVCNRFRDTIVLIQNAPPVVHLGNDTTLCVGSSLILTDTSTNATFLWSTNATTPSITVTNNGSYWLQVTQGTCPARDTIVATFLSPPPAFSLGSDTAYCTSFSRTITIGVPNVGYRWSTGATTSSITITSPGLYWGQDSNMCGVKRDTVLLVQNAPPIVNLGIDTTLCVGASLILSDTSTNATFLWSTANNGSLINVTTSGTYWLRVTQNNCPASDTIVATFLSPPPAFNIGNDTAYCTNFSRTLSINIPNVSYRWSTGATTFGITISVPNLYWGQDSNMCGVNRDTIVLIQNAPPIVNLGNDTTLCTGTALTLNDTSTNATFLWSTNATTPSITVTTGGRYWLQVTQNVCKGSDTIAIAFVNPLPVFSLGKDTAYCGNFTRTLTTGLGSKWSTGFIGPTISVSTPGVYWAEITNQCGTSSDTIQLYQNPIPIVSLGPDTTICTDSIYIIPGVSSAPSIIWTPATGLDSANIIAPTFKYSDSLNMSYTVIVTFDSTGCADTVHLNIKTESCESYIICPEAFSPNGDANNDYYTVFGNKIAEYDLRIYNRWGEMVFEDTNLADLNDLTKGWDGKYHGKPQEVGTFVYYITATDDYKKHFSKKGNIMLLR